MQITSSLMALALLAMGINAAPLNINTGAYSPALVVGDGAISFGGGEAEAGAAGGARRKARRDLANDKKVEKRQSSGFDRALTFAEAALTKGPDIQLGTGEGGAGVGIIVNNNQAAAGGGEAGRGGAAGGEGAGAGTGAGGAAAGEKA